MDKRSEEMAWSLLSFVLLWLATLLCSAKDSTIVSLDSRAVCAGTSSGTVYWASKEKSVVVVGRGANDRQLYRQCSVVVGAATAEASILQLSVEALHIEDCGVTLVVNQSHLSDFTSGTSNMAKIGCQHGTLRVLHSLEKHYVKVTVHKDNIHHQQYNFRINITVIDKLPERGPETHVVIIVGVTVLVVVGMALWLLVKYLVHRTHRWQEHCAERNMERAIRLYNSQETPPESDYMYTALPPQDVGATQPPAHHRNGHCHPAKNASGRGGRHRAGDITFVHADGHIETFRMRGSPQERRSGDSDHPPGSTAPHRLTGVAPPGRDRDRDSLAEGQGHGEDIVGECPPSYEEALHMPTPQDPRSPLYVNLDSKRDDNHST
ncbi:uncharacterized protein LOC143284895 [Babylonia areolata]|uniref:uncharacterized protein LOC143284895 n=1 Tax=Babylonia areolata TaxID=304850 RepID=UPI003FD160B6